MTQHGFIQPLDVLFLRDNHLFGAAAGDHGRALMPPWPSVFAGALRSRMLADADAGMDALNSGTLPAPLDTILGTPDAPGDFTLGDVVLARQGRNGLECFRPLPADIVVNQGKGESGYVVRNLAPQPLPASLASSAGAMQLPILRSNEQGKPITRFWLNHAGWAAHLRGEALHADAHLEPIDKLWGMDARLGIALDAGKRSAAKGRLYTTESIAMTANVGFLVTVRGAADALPDHGLLRLGGDGRGATLRLESEAPHAEPDWNRIRETGRFRIILTSPGLFPGGHQLPGVAANGDWRLDGASARQISQIGPRHQVVSGWDMAQHQPKAAQRCAPAGSVYWFEGFDGDLNALRKLSGTGLWNLTNDNADPARRAEGFNRIAIANA